MTLEVLLGAVWGIYCLVHYSRSNQKFDGAMTRRDSIYLVITMIFVGIIF